MKAAVLDAIGETALRRSSRVNAALAANDRVKYLFSLLQMAIAHAENPDHPAPSLKRERLAAGIDDIGLDTAVAGARREGDRIRIPGAARMLARIAQDMRVMAVPVLEAGPDATTAALQQRLEARFADLPGAADDLVDGPAILAMTSANRAGTDSLHLLVMDLHRQLNALQAGLAEATLDGAAVYGLDEADKPLVAAFMRGLNRTAPLKFDHPGLATTATRAGNRLVIQNDIGTTDAHVIVVHVEGRCVTITYTDIHPERLRFLKDMLTARDFSWNDGEQPVERAASGLSFEMAIGRHEAADDAALRDCLEFVGSRLVFLIDWNRARKELRGFLRGSDRIAVLRWAADKEVGHRGFLSLGGARLINQAIEVAASSALHFGDRLCDVLGDAAARDYVCFVLRAASEGLRAGQSAGMIHDRIRTELHAHVSNEGRRLLRVLVEHAALTFEIATVLREGLRDLSPMTAEQLARRARDFEHAADQKVSEIRDAARRRPEQAPLLRLAQTADDAADAMEEAAFLLGLLASNEAGGEALEALAGLADLVAEGTQEWVKTLADAATIASPGQGVKVAREDTEDFLSAVDRILALEHQADDVQRALTVTALRHARDFRQLHLYTTIGNSLEEAADSLKRAALGARDHVMGSVLGE
ncbi:MAG TPA: DUF47 family protein [Acetobacteraceae bacterium]|nr:DUF47 family protein [Acetobacteraceae bacterium]